jgi:hypothetical protein
MFEYFSKIFQHFSKNVSFVNIFGGLSPQTAACGTDEDAPGRPRRRLDRRGGA